MRKLSTLLVVLVALVMAFSLVACDGLTPIDPNKPIEEVKHSQVDPRTEQYVAYKADGTVIGEYKALATAINAATATDSFETSTDNFVLTQGSYVTTKDGTVVFRNQNGFTADNDDQFWFYINGNQLEAYDCYDNVLYSEYLKNSDVITVSMTGRGSSVKQYHNGYGMYSPVGDLMTDGAVDPNGDVYSILAARSWELSATMDAAVLQFPHRLGGITKLSYELDLTDVTITPNYEGTDDVYAFFGFYAWQDYYVVATGFACNVQTGAWYPFKASSRDDSFSDAQYNIGKTPVMTSTWHEEGYFTPDYAKVEMSIETVKATDDLGTYYYGDSTYKFYDNTGKVANEQNIVVDEELVGEFFAGVPYGSETTYVFIAGLDIRTESNGLGVFSKATDYTNGASFDNLKVTKATGYVPSVEEMSDVDYGYEIKAELRGQSYNILMAGQDYTAGVMDYTVLNTNACADFQMVDGADVYSFSYDIPNVASTPFGGKAAEYQAKIDSLKNATEENIGDFEEIINEVAEMYANGSPATSTIQQKFYLVLDFSPLKAAQDLFANNIPLTEKGDEFKAKFNELPSLSSYTYAGWSTTEEDATGYLLNDINAFSALLDEYKDDLTADDLLRLKYHVNMTDYNMYCDLAEKLSTMANDYTLTVKAWGKSTDMKTLTGVEVYEELITSICKIVNNKGWGASDNDDGNSNAVKEFNSDNNWLPAYHVMYIKYRLEEAGYELPLFADYYMELCGASEGFYEDVEFIDAVLRLAAMIENGAKSVTEEMAEIANTFMVGKEFWKEGGLVWNWNNHPTQAEFLYRNGYYKLYYGLSMEVHMKTYIETVQNFFIKRVGAVVIERSNGTNGIGFAEEVTAQDANAITEEAGKVIALFDAGKMYANDFDAFDAAIEKFNALSDSDKVIVESFSDYDYLCTLVDGTRNAIAALKDVTLTTALKVPETMVYGIDTALVEMTAQEGMTELLNLACNVAKGGTWNKEQNDDDNTYDYSNYLNFDHHTYPGMRMFIIVNNFKANNIELPVGIATTLEAINYDYFAHAVVSIQETARLAITYAQEGKTVADMTEEDYAIMGKYLGIGVELNKLLAWNWNDGNKFQSYYGNRTMAAVCLVEGYNNDKFKAIVEETWKMGDLFAKYTYKGVEYLSFYYQDEAEANNVTYGALVSSVWASSDEHAVWVDAEGNVVAYGTEGATLLTTVSEGVEAVMNDGVIVTVHEKCSKGPYTLYYTEDNMKVYLVTVDGVSKFVDMYGRDLDPSIDVTKITLAGTYKTYKYFEVLTNWLGEQGYKIRSNGWGYNGLPSAE